MSNPGAESHAYNNQNSSATETSNVNSKQQLNSTDALTQRQAQSAFQPPTNVEQCADKLQALNVTEQQDGTNHAGDKQPTSKVTMRCDAPPFSPSSATKVSSSEETKPTVGTDNVKPAMKTDYIYDLKKYKYDYFLSDLTCSFDREHGKFGAPTGICALPDDRLLVANFDRDAVLLMDIKGVVHQIFKDLPTPKAVIHHSTGSASQAVVATRKEAILLDIATGKIVIRSKMRGFYPWNIQYIHDQDIFAACDPSGERIVFLDKNLAEINVWSFHDSTQDHLLQTQPQLYQKVYPYAAYFLANNTSFVLTHRQDKCHLQEFDNNSVLPKGTYQTPPSLQSYSIYVDSTKKCLIADKLNHRLVSVDKDSTVEEYRCKSIQEPYSMTFLSDGTLCVSDWNKSHGSSGGISVISEVNLKDK